MSDWADEMASSVTDEWWDHLKTWNQLDTPTGDFDHIYWEDLEKLIAVALHQSAADVRVQGMDLYEWLRNHISWSLETFGDGARTEGLIKHIEKELDEVRAQPNDIMEWVDVIILACDGAWRAGYSAREICLALQQKQIINQERQWVRTPQDQPTEHTR